MHSFLDEKIAAVDLSRLPMFMKDEEVNIGPLVVLHVDERLSQLIPELTAFLPQWVVFPMRPFTYACGLRNSQTIW